MDIKEMDKNAKEVAKWPTNTTDLDEVDHELSHEDTWIYRSERRPELAGMACLAVQPTTNDINKRFHAILPYLDKDHSNSAFLQKFRATVHGMTQGENLLDKEAAFYAAVLTPLVFLQNYRDTWCLLERFHRALRLYQISHPTDKRTSLKLLQNFRAINQKVQTFIWNLKGSRPPIRSTSTEPPELDEEESQDKWDIPVFKQIAKNLGFTSEN